MMMCDHRDSLITMTTVTANIMIPATLTVTRTVPPPSAGPQPECRGRRWPAPPWPRPAARAVGRRPGNWPARIQVTDGPLADRLLVSEQLRADIRVTEAGINIPGAPLLNASRARTWRAEQRRSSRQKNSSNSRSRMQSTRTSVEDVASGESADGSPQKSTSSGESLVIDDPNYIGPSGQDLLLTDVTQEILNTRIAPELAVHYLSASEAENASFPVTGILFGLNRRLMVNLLVRRRESHKFLNILFLVDTGSPVSYLCDEAISALIGKDNALPKFINVFVQGDQVLECHLSPQDGHFHDVNVIGMDFLATHDLSIQICYKRRTFQLLGEMSFESSGAS